MADPVGSPLWFVDRLVRKLDAERPQIELYSRYYEGDHPLPMAERRLRNKFRRLLKASRANWTGLIIDALVDRLHVEGFLLNSEDGTGDEDAWKMWQENDLDSGSELVHTEAATCGESYVSVWEDPANPEFPLIAPEHPSQIICAYDRRDRRQLAAALKVWEDEWTGDRWATLYLPEFIYKFKAPKMGGTWTEREDPIENFLGEVPIVPFRNNPRLLTGGRSEIAGVTDIQDRINKTLFDRLVASETSGARQRYVTGMEIQTDPKTNQPIPPFESMLDRMLQAEDPQTQFGEFSATDLGPFISAVESDVTAMAAITTTPPQYLLGAMVNISGDALVAAESGHSRKAASRARHFGESWERVIRLGFAVTGDPRAKVKDSQTIWGDFEARNEAQRVDALVKMRGLGVPLEAIWERWGASQQEITRWKEQLEAEPQAPVETTG